MIYPYEILEVPDSAPQAEIRKQYLRKIQQYTPEQNPDKFRQISEAYQMVKDETGRARLGLFGIPVQGSPPPLASLIPVPENKRQRVGAAAWLDVVKETKKQ